MAVTFSFAFLAEEGLCVGRCPHKSVATALPSKAGAMTFSSAFLADEPADVSAELPNGTAGEPAPHPFVPPVLEEDVLSSFVVLHLANLMVLNVLTF